MYKSTDSIFSSNIPVIQLSHSDFSVLEIDYDAEVAEGKHEKMYLGIMSCEAYPLRSPNPHSINFRPEDYVSRFPG